MRNGRWLAALVLAGCGGGGDGGPVGPATVASVTLSAATVQLASGASVQLTATAKDAGGATVSGGTVTWAITDAAVATVTGGGSLTGVKIGTTTVRATIAGKSAEAPVTVTVGAPTAVTVVAGAGQTAQVGAAVATAPRVRVRDFGDNAVAGATVQFAVTGGGGRLTGTTTVTTDAAGEATAPAWALGVLPGANTLSATAGPATAAITATAAYTRAAADRTDEVAGDQIHVIYAVPSDQTDRALDTSGRLAISVAVQQRFALTQTGGRRLRLDTFNGGALDITFVRLPQTDLQLRTGLTPQQNVEAALNGLGLLAAPKIYAVFYDGSSTDACAQAPVGIANGRVAAVYLRGRFGGGTQNCLDLTGMAETATETPRYWDFAMLHEMLHVLGIVGAAAPHHAASAPGHVGDAPTDLMYAGAAPWQPSTFDVGKDDYAGNALAGGLPNFMTSSYSEAAPVTLLDAMRQATPATSRWTMPAWVRMDLMEGRPIVK